MGKPIADKTLEPVSQLYRLQILASIAPNNPYQFLSEIFPKSYQFSSAQEKLGGGLISLDTVKNIA